MLKRRDRLHRVLLVAVALLLQIGVLSAQSDDALLSNTPYSLFGVGELNKLGTSYTLSMGGIGIGLRDGKKINLANPASLTERDSLAFMLDFGVSQSNTLSSSGESKAAYNLFNMHHMVVTFPLYKKSAFSVGIVPYSSVGYSFKERENRPEIISEVGDVVYQREGRGGINRGFLGLSANLFEKFSVGAEAIYYFGTINKNSDIRFADGTFSAIRVGSDYVVRSFSSKFGVQYKEKLKNDLSLVAGATYLIGGKLGGDITNYTFATSSASVRDTINYAKVDETLLYIPGEIGVGVTLSKKDKWLVGLDYTRQDWSGVNFAPTPGVDFTTGTNNSFKLGFEYIPNLYDLRYYSKRLSYKGGAYYESGYMKIDGKQIGAVGLTAGITLPLIRMTNGIGIAVDVGQRGLGKESPIKERYLIFNLSFSLHDIWFLKFRYD